MIAISKNKIAIADNNNPKDLLVKITVKPSDDKNKWQYLYVTLEELEEMIKVMKVFSTAINRLQ